MRPELTSDELHELFLYNANEGIFRWRKKTSKFSHVQIGDIAGTTDHHRGYVYIKINNKQYAAHRLAWLYVYGEFPLEQIDHINRCRSDNRIANLRAVNNAANAMNRNIRKDNSTGVNGVSFDGTSKKYRAYICGKHLGSYETFDAAVRARMNADYIYSILETID